MGNKLTPSRKLYPLRFAGRRRLLQIEARSILQVLDAVQSGSAPPPLDDKARMALRFAYRKIVSSLIEAQRLSIPKGHTARPADLPRAEDEL